MKAPILIICFCWILLFISIPLVSNAQTGSLEGYVNCIDGGPIEGVIVTLGGTYSDTTNNSGYFSISGIPAGMYSLTLIFGGFSFPTWEIIIVEGMISNMDFTIPCGEFTIEPLDIEVTLEPNAQTTEMITITNETTDQVEWQADLEVFPPGSTDELFDLIFQVPLSGIMETGAETNGEYIYTTSPFEGTFYRYDMSGLFIGSFSLASGIYDLAYDGSHFYGSFGTTTIMEMDLDMEVIISTFNVPQNVKAITYDSDEEVFYGYNWGGDIIVFDQSGALLNTLPIGPNDPVYSSFAYDNVSSGSPYLWGYGLLDGDPNVLVQVALPDFQYTGVIASLSDILVGSVTNGAAGLFVSPDIVPGIFAIAGIVQDEWMWALELTETSQWIAIEPTSGVLEPGESEEMSVYFDASDLFPWEYNAEIQFNTIPDVGSPVVDLTLWIEGQPGVMDLQYEYNCTNVFLEWETLPPGCMYVDSFHVYKDSLYYATTYECQFIDSLEFPETEHTYFTTGYFYDGWESSLTNVVSVTVPLPAGLEPTNIDANIINNNILCLNWGTNACLLPEYYSLYKNGELLAQLNEPEYCDTLFASGNYEYYVTATYYFGEFGPSNTFYFLFTETDETNQDIKIEIYPNPVKDKIIIQSPSEIDHIGLFDLRGIVLRSEFYKEKEIQLDVSNLNPGIYFLKLKTVNGIILKKVVIQ